MGFKISCTRVVSQLGLKIIVTFEKLRSFYIDNFILYIYIHKCICVCVCRYNTYRFS